MKMISPGKKLIHTVVYPVEKTIKQREFRDFTHFDGDLNLKIKEIFC